MSSPHARTLAFPAQALAELARPAPGLVLVYSDRHTAVPAALPFCAPCLTLGQDPGNTLTLADPAVASHHARVERRDDGFWLVALSSHHDCLVNGEPIVEHRLTPHDLVRLGNTLFRHTASGADVFCAYPLSSAGTRPLLLGGCQIDARIAAISELARSHGPVLMTGEAGTGTTLAARELHRQSGGRGLFRVVDASAPAVERELLGVLNAASGARTYGGASRTQTAQVRTLLLKDIDALPWVTQTRLVRILDARSCRAPGACDPADLDVRLCGSSHRNLQALVDRGEFREDLLAHLRGRAVHLPALRERREDLWQLMHHFLSQYGRPELRISLETMVAAAHYDWPGNVRELELAMKTAAAKLEATTLLLWHMPDAVRRLAADIQLSRLAAARTQADAAAIEQPAQVPPRGTSPGRAQLQELLARHRGNLAAVGRELGRERAQVYRWLRRHGIDLRPYRH